MLNYVAQQRPSARMLKVCLCLGDVPVEPHHMAGIAFQSLLEEVFSETLKIMRLEARSATGTLCQSSNIRPLNRKTIREPASKTPILLISTILHPNCNQLRFDVFGGQSPRAAHHFQSLFKIGMASRVAVSHSCKQLSFLRRQDSSRLT